MKIVRPFIHAKYSGRCAYCGCEITVKQMQVDHLISRRNFTSHVMNKWKVPTWLNHLTIDDVNHIDNLMPSCRSCNNFKSTFCLETFRSEIQDQINRFRKYKPTFNLAERYGLIKEVVKPVEFYFEICTNQQAVISIAKATSSQ